MNPSYYVCFSTATIIASTILFHGLNTTGGTNTVSLLCGFYIISLGVYLLVRHPLSFPIPSPNTLAQNVSRSDPNGASPPNDHPHGHSLLETGILPRMSMSNRLSLSSETNSLPMRSPRTSREQRRGSQLYRGGGVEPLFEYEGREEEESGDERRELVEERGRGVRS